MSNSHNLPHPLKLTEAYLELLKSHVGKLNDIQLDQLDIANHLLANLAVQLGIGQQAATPVVFEEGQPVEVLIDPGIDQQSAYWQKTTIVERVRWDDTNYRYKTAATGRQGDWLPADHIRARLK